MAYANKNIDLRFALLVVFLRFLIGKGGIGLRLIWLTNWDYLLRDKWIFPVTRHMTNSNQHKEKAILDHQLSSNLVCTGDWNCAYISLINWDRKCNKMVFKCKQDLLRLIVLTLSIFVLESNLSNGIYSMPWKTQHGFILQLSI